MKPLKSLNHLFRLTVLFVFVSLISCENENLEIDNQSKFTVEVVNATTFYNNHLKNSKLLGVPSN